jgi:hypothetical protein
VIKVSLKEVDLEKLDLITQDIAPGIYACLTITDSGIGMDKDLTKKIFVPFFTTKKKAKERGWVCQLFTALLREWAVLSKYIVNRVKVLNSMFTCQWLKALLRNRKFTR